MARLLVSWIAHTHDFIRRDGVFQGVADKGPTAELHRLYYGRPDYQLAQLDRHILLYATTKDEPLAERLAIHLRGQFPGRQIETELLPLNDIGDLAEVKSKVEAWLLRHRENEIIIFFSPGTSIMQLSWYICHHTLGLRTRLVQTRRPQDLKPGQEPLTEIRVEQSAVPVSAVIREDNLRKPAATHYQRHILPPALSAVYGMAAQAAQADTTTILLRGESGTGKEQLARYVHDQSPRRTGEYREVNCAAFLNDQLLESRLFGHRKGAFTGADKDTVGVFEDAAGGTVFLDEIGDISPGMQVLLLRVLQERQILAVGDPRPRSINVRIVAATNADLEAKCQAGQFRWDLYYRLAIIELELPALREWPPAERGQLLEHLLAQKQQEHRKATPLRLSAAARRHLLDYPFPGNIRELQNTIDHLYVLHAAHEIEPRHLPRRLREPAPASLSLKLADVEREHLLRVLALKNGVKRQAAQALDLDERTLAAKLRAYETGATEAPRQGRRARSQPQ